MVAGCSPNFPRSFPQVITKLLVPYTRVSLAHIARELNDIPEEDVESLLVSLILDGKVGQGVRLLRAEERTTL
jgi:hypothetical protein